MSSRRRWAGAAILPAALLCSCVSSGASTDGGGADRLVAGYVRKGLPSAVAAVIRDGNVVYETAQGVRRLGDPTAVTVDDAFHIGSDTKAMTSLLAAMLVEEGKLAWGSTVAEVLGPEAAGGYGAVRLEELLSHTGGVPAVLPREPWLSFFGSAAPVAQERERMVREVVALKPFSAPGAAFLYSNLGYLVAGRMIEVASGRSWEDLLRERVFGPLDMDGAGFGPPASAGVEPPDAPWGHSPRVVDPGEPGADNPPALGPAGTVHASLRDMERYVGVYLRGGTDARGNSVVSSASLEEIYRPRLAGYGLGWATLERGGVSYLQHTGSNTMFVCQILMAPARRFAVIVMANRGDGEALRQTGRLLEELLRSFGG